MICTFCASVGDWIREHGLGMWHTFKTSEMHAGFWWENLKERHFMEDICIDWCVNSEAGPKI
jgi:hypothetical protein